MPAARTAEQSAQRDDRRALMLSTAGVLGLLAVGAALLVSTVYAYAPVGVGGGSLGGRLAANAVGVVVMLTALRRSRVATTRSMWEMAHGITVAAMYAAVARVLAQSLFHVYNVTFTSTLLVQLSAGLVAGVAGGAAGVVAMVSRRRFRTGIEAGAAAKVRIELALRALEDEEVRVRREVAEGLHGSLQQRLVLIVARLDRVIESIGSGFGTDADVRALHEIREQVDDVREGDVREASRMLYPDSLEIGMVPAVRSLLARMPPDIGTRLVVSDDVRTLDDPVSPQLTQSERLLAVRVVEEAVTNALRHGGAHSLRVSLDLDVDCLAVAVVDDGSGFDAVVSGARSGTRRLQERLVLIGGRLNVSSVPGEGTRVEARVPISTMYDA
jgi:two-component system, NarL family, sensor histidine kinase UhpB